MRQKSNPSIEGTGNLKCNGNCASTLLGRMCVSRELPRGFELRKVAWVGGRQARHLYMRVYRQTKDAMREAGIDPDV